ncbi:hypothetical protein [Mitsuokella multacida]|uniref:hypothetical protein n=1 Tax=Mitsuokella multacida TaxID=52226 RepID=UPI0026DC5612|nr:hypothetical protein [Mitsuokella multacida]
MNIKLNIYPKDKNGKTMKEILLLGIASISFIAVMTFTGAILNPEMDVVDIAIFITGIWISITILFFSVDKWGKLGDRLICTLSICIVLLSLGILSYHTGIISDEGKKAIQETASYDALLPCPLLSFTKN